VSRDEYWGSASSMRRLEGSVPTVAMRRLTMTLPLSTGSSIPEAIEDPRVPVP
jgi:hypothetical protein